jgi:hypothetical protein
VPAHNSFDFAVIRVVPRVDREEFVNAGVIVFCLGQRFLGAMVHVDEARLNALWPELDLSLLRENLEVFPKISSGAADGGPIAKLSLRERFHWLVAPRSTVIQVSPVHSGLCESPESVLRELFQQLVLRSLLSD